MKLEKLSRKVLVPAFTCVVVECSAAVEGPNRMQQSNWH